MDVYLHTKNQAGIYSLKDIQVINPAIWLVDCILDNNTKTRILPNTVTMFYEFKKICFLDFFARIRGKNDFFTKIGLYLYLDITTKLARESLLEGHIVISCKISCWLICNMTIFEKNFFLKNF